MASPEDVELLGPCSAWKVLGHLSWGMGISRAAPMDAPVMHPVMVLGVEQESVAGLGLVTVLILVPDIIRQRCRAMLE